MECPGCQHENPDEARFCGECGSSLIHAVTCASCGQANPGGQKFCNGCGLRLEASAVPSERDPRAYTPKHLVEKILRSKSALEGERKQVTVLFVDVRRSMEIAERMDPEPWSLLMQRLFQMLSDGVGRYEGFVDKFTGDGIMALFGAPIAHEDHAQRACYAALHLRDSLRAYSDELRLSQGLDFAVRMGINSGEVVVGRIGDDLRMEYTAHGHTVGLAQRMESLAPPGGVCVSEATGRLVSGYVTLRDLGASQVKGASQPVRVFELEGLGEIRSRFELARARGLTRFVGRDDDMAVLEQALSQARAGHGQVVGVVAEAGGGKSRLCFEFVERCRARGLTVLQGTAAAHGRSGPFLPILQILRQYFGIVEQEGDRVVRERIAGRLLLIDEGLREFLPVVFDFMGSPDPERPARGMDPDARQRQLFNVWRRVVARGEGASVTFIEDLHWIDAGSEVWLEQMVEAAAGSKTLLLLNFRPEYRAAWMQKTWYRRLPLLPLTSTAIHDLLRDLLGADPRIAGLADTIYESTAGNPFFAEEVVQNLIESGGLEGSRGAYRLVTPVERLEVPATVQSVLAARIDRLGEREKQVLQAASVIGRDFSEPILSAVLAWPPGDLSGALQALRSGEFLHEQSLYPVTEYAFKHPLTQEVALGSQLREHRARTHGAVARAREKLDADRLDEQAALLAYHWEAAGEAETAARWHARAARWSGVDNAATALRHWHQVRTLLAGAHESETLRLEAAMGCLSLAWRMGMDEQQARAILADGLALAEQKGDLRSRVLLLISFSSMYSTGTIEASGRPDEVDEAFELGRQSGDPELRFTVHEEMIDRLHFTGRLTNAAALCDEYISLGRALESGTIVRGNPVVWAIARRAWVWNELGRLEAAADSLPECAESLRKTPATGEYQSYTELVWAQNRVLAGDIDAACLHARRGFDIADKLGGNLARVWADELLGVTLACVGQTNAAVEHLERALRRAREARTWLKIEAEILAYLAEARLYIGDGEAAQRLAEEAIESGRSRKTPVWEARAYLALARVLLARNSADAKDDIETALATCLSLLHQTRARVYEPYVHELRAELAHVGGDVALGERELREAHRLFAAIGATGHAARLADKFEATAPVSSTKGI
jgi:class 3 adenylate cyclase/tetratricopeptide (TPR) repeat protein